MAVVSLKQQGENDGILPKSLHKWDNYSNQSGGGCSSWVDKESESYCPLI